MQQRIIFNSVKTRDKFFDKAQKSFNFDDWKSVYESLNISRSVFDKYRHGDLSIPYNLFIRLRLKLDSKFISSMKNDIIILSDNWGQINGGRNAYKMNKKAFERGRIKGLTKIVKKNKVESNLPLTRELSYFVGLFIGDGFANKYGSSYIVQFVGHRVHERDFYNKFLFDLVTNLFSIKPKIVFDNRMNAVRLNIYSKDLLEILNKRFEIKLGRKFDKVLIPSEIINSTPDNILSCIAGLYDAEGSVFIDKRKSYSSGYPRLTFQVKNPKLTKQIFEILNEERINISTHSDFKVLNIYGRDNIRFFLNKVPVKNDKILSKLN